MTTRLYTHEACLAHDPGASHPERPERLAAVTAALDAEEFSGLDRVEAPLVERAQLEFVHAVPYLDQIEAVAPAEGRVRLDPDTAISPGSLEAARRAAGAVAAAVDAVMAGAARNAFCAVRPPGHHAEADRAMGFCVYNNVAVGAEQARRTHGAKRVAVMDFDVHHGNGTQHMFEPDRDLLYASTHQYPFYPGTGARDEVGVGNVFNRPLPADSGSAEFRAAMVETILPAIRDFEPDLVMISAGFDAHRQDPLAQLNLTEGDFDWATRELMAIADACCEGRLVSSLEGGYDLDGLAKSAVAHVRVLMDH